MSRWEWVKLLLMILAVSGVLASFYGLIAYAVFRYG
jgi:hypothetical protein